MTSYLNMLYSLLTLIPYIDTIRCLFYNVYFMLCLYCLPILDSHKGAEHRALNAQKPTDLLRAQLGHTLSLTHICDNNEFEASTFPRLLTQVLEILIGLYEYLR